MKTKEIRGLIALAKSMKIKVINPTLKNKKRKSYSTFKKKKR